MHYLRLNYKFGRNSPLNVVLENIFVHIIWLINSSMKVCEYTLQWIFKNVDLNKSPILMHIDFGHEDIAYKFPFFEIL